MSNTLQWLGALNPVVQGAMIALGGVIASQIISFANNALQLWNNRRESRLDRELELKKDVYLQFASERAQCSSAFMKLADPFVALEDVNDLFQRSTSAGARLHLVASAPTVAQLVRLEELVARKFLDLMPGAVELRNHASDMKICQQSAQKALDEQNVTLELIKQHNLELNSDPRKFEILRSRFDRTQELYESECVKRDEHQASTRALQPPALKKSIAAIESLHPDMTDLMAKIRTEIGIDEDCGKAYLAAARVNFSDMTEVVSKTIDDSIKKLDE